MGGVDGEKERGETFCTPLLQDITSRSRGKVVARRKGRDSLHLLSSGHNKGKWRGGDWKKKREEALGTPLLQDITSGSGGGR